VAVTLEVAQLVTPCVQLISVLWSTDTDCCREREREREREQWRHLLAWRACDACVSTCGNWQYNEFGSARARGLANKNRSVIDQPDVRSSSSALSWRHCMTNIASQSRAGVVKCRALLWSFLLASLPPLLPTGAATNNGRRHASVNCQHRQSMGRLRFVLVWVACDSLGMYLIAGVLTFAAETIGLPTVLSAYNRAYDYIKHIFHLFIHLFAHNHKYK